MMFNPYDPTPDPTQQGPWTDPLGNQIGQSTAGPIPPYGSPFTNTSGFSSLTGPYYQPGTNVNDPVNAAALAAAPNARTGLNYTGAAPAPSGGTGGSGGSGGGGGSAFAPWSGVFTPPTPQALPQAPQFNAPGYTPPPAFNYQDFKGPSVSEALNDPGYQFRLSQGQNALQNWAAARGTLNDSGTAKALTDYGQNAGSQEYQNVWNRDLNAYQTNRAGAVQQYNTNYQTQYQDPYTASYQAARDQFAPKMTEYGTVAANTQHQNDISNANAFNNYYLGFQDFENRRNGAITVNGMI